MTKIAVVGCGYWGSKHVRVLSGLSAVSEVAIVESNPGTRDAMLSVFPAAVAFDDINSAIQYADGVVIATPPETHCELALKALRNGKHVLVEKPITKSLEESLILVREAHRSNSVLMTGHTFLFNPAVNELRKRVAKGELGEIYYLYSSRLNLGPYRRDVDVMWDLAPHDITIMSYLLDSLPTAVSAWSESLAFQGIQDVACVRLHYGELGVCGFIHLSWLDPKKTRTVTLVGTDKMAVYDDLADEPVRIYDRGVSQLGDRPRQYERPLGYRYGDIVSPHIPAGEPLALQDQHFIECICNRTIPTSSGEDGILVVAVLEAIDDAKKTGRTVSVNYPAELNINSHKSVFSQQKSGFFLREVEGGSQKVSGL